MGKGEGLYKNRTYEEDMRVGWVVAAVLRVGNNDEKCKVNPYQGNDNTIDPD